MSSSTTKRFIDDGVRCQVLALHGAGLSRKQIYEVTGVSPTGFFRLLRKAKERGYVVGGPVLLAYVKDAKRSGRPTKAQQPKGPDATLAEEPTEPADQTGFLQQLLLPEEDDDAIY